MNDKWILVAMIGLFMMCEKVEGRQWGDSTLDYGDVVVTIFEVLVIVVLVMCCVGMFQQYDAMDYFGVSSPWIPTAPPGAYQQGGCTSVKITMDDLRRVVSHEVKQELKKKDMSQRMKTVEEEDSIEMESRF